MTLATSSAPCLHFPTKFEWSTLWILPKFSAIPPFGFSVTTDPSFYSPTIKWSPLKFSPPGENNDQSLTIEYIHVPEPSSLFRVDSEESQESAHTWLFAIPPKLAKITKGKCLSILGARGFSCAVSGFFSLGFAACAFGQRPNTCRPAADEAPRRSRKETSGTQVSISDQKYRKVSQRGHVRVSLRAHAGHMRGTCCQYFYHCKLHW